MADMELSEDQQRIVAKVEKLLRLAAKNPNQEEAAAATAKAQELLAIYNLQAVVVSGEVDKSTVREQREVRGGMYDYQRELWAAVARLNFCIYWTIRRYRLRKRRRPNPFTGEMETREVHGHEYQHVLVGRLVNTRSSEMMTQYLEQTFERLVRERFPLSSQRFKREAVAFREGLSDAVVTRLYERRERMREAEERRAAAATARSGVSTSQALTIGTLEEQELSANNDFRHGEGWSARQAQRRAEQAEAERRADEEYTRWAEANPEEARRQQEESERERRRHRPRYSGGPGSRGGVSGRERRQMTGEYHQGWDEGKRVSLDLQTTAPQRGGLIAGRS